MADFTYNKDGPSLYPLEAIESSWTRLEPLITADQLRDTHLMLLPLISGIADPITGKRMVLTNAQIDRIIIQAVALGEIETGLQFFPTQHSEKLAFDAFEFRSFGYFKIKNRPISSIQSLEVVPANEQSIYSVPVDWIEVANLPMGQVNIHPIGTAVTGGLIPVSQTSGGAFFLSILGAQNWVPAFWRFKFCTGFPDGKLPAAVNAYIGTIAALEILSMLAATYARSTSHSISLDGQSQSISGLGPNLYKVRIEELETKRKMLCKKLKTAYGLAMFSGNV